MPKNCVVENFFLCEVLLASLFLDLCCSWYYLESKCGL